MPFVNTLRSSTTGSFGKKRRLAAALGNLFGWGRNSSNVIPDKPQGSVTSPSMVDTTTTWARPAISVYSAICTRTDGTLWSWGINSKGNLGLGDVTARSIPTQIGVLTNWSKPTAGGNRSSGHGVHALCIKTDGTLWGWGNGVNIDNADPRGLNGIGNRSSPVQVGADTWLHVSSSAYASVGIKTAGTLWGCGYGSAGGGGANTFTQIGAASDWALVEAHSTSNVLVKTNGTLWVRGNATGAQLGLNGNYPGGLTQNGALTNWAKPLSGLDNAVYTNGCIKTDGTLWMWGSNFTGQLGQNDTVRRSSPVQVGSDTDWSLGVVGGAYGSDGSGFCVAVKTNGTLWAWGTNQFGQLGQGNTTYHSSPIQVGVLTNWVRPALGFRHIFCTTT